MKKLLFLFSLVTSIICFGDAFEFINSNDGYSYIQINENIGSFTFKSDWHSLGSAGKIGYVIYSSDMNDSEKAAYMEANANNPQFGKKINNGVVSLGSLSAGDKVGFYEVRPNGGVYTHSSFEDWKDEIWLAFDKNGGHGKDEWMTIQDVSYSTSDSPSAPSSPNGAPLPGALAVFLVGIAGAGAYKAGKKKI